jgi:hypothetical protein
MATLPALIASLLATQPATQPAVAASLVIDATASATALELEQPSLPTPPSFATLIQAQLAPEVLQGFDTILLTQINALFGSENLPVANGGAVEPGVYVTVSSQQLLIFDAKVDDLQAGRLPPGPASRECKSGCRASLWAAFRSMWLRSLDEAQTFALEVPVRVLFAAEASVPASTLIELAYAAGETRPAAPPAFSLLVNAGNAGLRARPFYVLPPGGLRIAPGDNILALRVRLGAGESFELSAAHPRFTPAKIEGTGWKQLAVELAGVKKRNLNKAVIIIDVGGSDVTVGDVVMAMVAAQKQFPTVVLTDGVPVRWG